VAIRKKYDTALAVQFEQAWKDRIQAVADHPTIADSLASVVRDCVELALPGFELELGIRQLDDLTEGELDALGLNRLPNEAPKREDRAAGSFGWFPPEG